MCSRRSGMGIDIFFMKPIMNNIISFEEIHLIKVHYPKKLECLIDVINQKRSNEDKVLYIVNVKQRNS